MAMGQPLKLLPMTRWHHNWGRKPPEVRLHARTTAANKDEYKQAIAMMHDMDTSKMKTTRRQMNTWKVSGFDWKPKTNCCPSECRTGMKRQVRWIVWSNGKWCTTWDLLASDWIYHHVVNTLLLPLPAALDNGIFLIWLITSWNMFLKLQILQFVCCYQDRIPFTQLFWQILCDALLFAFGTVVLVRLPRPQKLTLDAHGFSLNFAGTRNAFVDLRGRGCRVPFFCRLETIQTRRVIHDFLLFFCCCSIVVRLSQ